ncbi:hypothetical protein M0805_004213 [Coniferiporia weirii]|nr:hypothetical protein M0805_004213 [Coniferiporia weirii]
MSSFFSSLANKAQTAFEGSPLADQVSQLQSKLQSHGGSAERPTANEAAAQGGLGARSNALGSITHQFKTLQMQYSSVGPVQRIITMQKSVCLDFNSVCKDAKSQSKELYMWGQHENEDLKDVTDRLAYLSFVQGALSGTLSSELDASRASLKVLRNAENALEPKRNERISLQNQIARLEHDQQKGSDKRIADLKRQLQKAEEDDSTAEKDLEILKRRTVIESERSKWAALREYGEKLVLLAEASTSLVSALPTIPPSADRPYTGARSTAATRASLQHALDNYKPGSLSHSFQPSVADLNRSDSRSFGVTHASELSSMTPPAAPDTPPAKGPVQGPAQTPSPANAAALAKTPEPILTKTPPAPAEKDASPSTATAPAQASPPVNPAALNNSPTHIPNRASPPSEVQNSLDTTMSSSVAVPVPTVAETGVPVFASAGGPGPSSGSLKDPKSDGINSSTLPQFGASTAVEKGKGIDVSASSASTKLESAEEEKTRLQREERERLLRGSAVTQKYETAEEEKSRLEREERERLLNENNFKQGGSEGPSGKGDEEDATPPPYDG